MPITNHLLCLCACCVCVCVCVSVFLCQALIVPEIDEKDFLEHCEKNGSVLTLTVCALQQLHAHQGNYQKEQLVLESCVLSLSRTAVKEGGENKVLGMIMQLLLWQQQVCVSCVSCVSL